MRPVKFSIKAMATNQVSAPRVSLNPGAKQSCQIANRLVDQYSSKLSELGGKGISELQEHRVHVESLRTSLRPATLLSSPAPESVRGDQQPSESSLLEALGVQNLKEAKDVAAALLMSEAVYKAVDGSLQQAVADISKAAAGLPAALQQDLSIQWSLPHVRHRFLLAEGDSSIYIAFMGTKRREDIITNSAVYQELLWKEQRFRLQGEPAAHTGFVRRARSIPVQKLLQAAEAKGKKLVLCGHSLGGGVAELCALDLLHAAKQDRLPNIHAIGFASPAIGNQALASFVQQRGWKRFLTSYLLPEDRLGRWLAFLPQAEEPEDAAPAASPSSSQLMEPAASRMEPSAACASFPSKLQPPAVSGAERGADSVHLSNNIVSFPALQVPRQKQTAAQAKSAAEREEEKYALAAWAARFAYRAVTFPLWAHRSFVPVSRRLFLNTEGVSPSQGCSDPETLANISFASVGEGESPAAGEVLRDGSGQSLLLSMHRLPSYRSRLKQISQGALQPAGKVPSRPPSVRLSGSIAEQVKLRRASLVQPVASLYSHLEECMRSAGFAAPWPRHWQKLLSNAVASPRTRGMWGAVRGWWERHVRGGDISHSLPDCLLLALQGTGLEHCTHFSLVMPGGRRVPAEIVHVPGSPFGCGQPAEGGKALGTLLGWLGILQAGRFPQPAETVLLRVEMSQAEADRVRACQTDDQGTKPQLAYLSAFHSGSIDISPCPKPALRTPRSAATQTGLFPARFSNQICQKC